MSLGVIAASFVDEVAPAYDDEVLADSPLVYWRFDSSSAGTITDLSGNARHGWMGFAVTGGAPLVEGMFRSWQVTAPMEFGYPDDETWMDRAAWSVELWFATTDVDNTLGLVCRDNFAGNRHWDLHINEAAAGGDGHVDIRGWTVNTSSQVASAQATLNDGNIHHAVGTYDGATLRLYIDGAPSGTPVAVSGLNSNVTAPITLSGAHGGNGIDGRVQCFAYYPAALSAARVAAHWQAGTGFLALSRTASDTASATDGAAGFYSRARSAADTAPATNALARTVARFKATANTAAAADSLAATTNVYDLAVLADSPLVYWKMAEVGGTSVADSSGNARTGTMSATIVPAASLVRGQARGNAFTNDAMTIADATWQDQTSRTVEIWMKTTDTASPAKGLACRDNAAGNRHWDLHLTETVTGRITWTGWVTNTRFDVDSTATTYADGNIHHIVGTYDGTTMRLYIDGVEAATPVTQAGLNSNVTSQIRVGGHTGLTGVTGTLQSFAYYGTALSSARIAAHYAAGV